MDQPTISIHKNGKWYWGEVEMFRRNIIKILARNIVRENDGSYFIAMGQEKQALIVEDVPFYATGIHVNEEGRLVLTFHDLQEMVLDKTLQLFRKGNVPYIGGLLNRLSAIEKTLFGMELPGSLTKRETISLYILNL